MSKTPAYVASVLLTVVLLFAIPGVAQQPAVSAAPAAAKPYHDGPVWTITFIRAKAGMEDRYLRYLTQEWKREQQAMKSAGYTLDYKVITTEPHGPQDFNVILMTQFKDLASMEANSDKMEQLGEQLFGGMQKIEAGYQDRSSYREVIGDRLGREIILEPKPAGAK
jgi:hypothetical protein